MSISYKVSDAREAYKLLVRIHTEWLLTSDPHENYLIGVAAAEIARLRAVEDSVASVAQIAPNGIIDATNDKTALAAIEAARREEREACATLKATAGVQDVAAERARQIEKEGWDEEHDDAEHADGTALARAAIAYARHYVERKLVIEDHGVAAYQAEDPAFYGWPWERMWWKPKDPRRDLVRAAALLIAEIDLLDRTAAIRARKP